MLSIFICIASILVLPSYCFSKCFIPGECSGTAYTIEEVSNVEKCIWKCWESSICKWSSYDPNKHFCNYYQFDSDCDVIDISNCPLCLINAKDCQKESVFDEITKLREENEYLNNVVTSNITEIMEILKEYSNYLINLDEGINNLEHEHYQDINNLNDTMSNLEERITDLEKTIEIEGLVEVKRNQTLQKFSDKWSCWGLFFKVEAEITVNSQYNDWMSVFHFTNNGDQNVQGSRIPAIYIKTNQFFITSDGAFYDALFTFEFEKKYHIVIQQYPVEDKVFAEIKINGEIIHSRENNVAKSFLGVKVYISNPWYQAFTSDYGLLENLKITRYSM